MFLHEKTCLSAGFMQQSVSVRSNYMIIGFLYSRSRYISFILAIFSSVSSVSTILQASDCKGSSPTYRPEAALL